MISRYEATLNGVALSSINHDLLILDIQYGGVPIEIGANQLAHRDGAIIYRQYREKATVTITFELHIYDIADRQGALRDVNLWAKNGGILEINDRPEQRLRCVVDSYAAIDSVRDWTKPLQITFAAYENPFWEAKSVESLTLSGSSGSGSLAVPGNYDGALISVNVSSEGTLTNVTLRANGEALTLSGMSVSSFQISYDSHQIQSIKSGNTSLLAYRSGVSDLLAKCGDSNSLSFTANTSATVVFRVRGLWV